MGKKIASLPAGTLMPSAEITPDELQLAVRNHSMPLEALRYDVTPVGLHYLLIHFDIPFVDPASWRLGVGGLVSRPLSLSLEDLTSRPASRLRVTLECAGNGRSRLSPRPLSQPWLVEAVGTAEWTGISLGPILREAAIGPDARHVVFTGLDAGVQGDVAQNYERSLEISEAMRDDVILAYAVNGQPLPPQHGFPLRLIVPGWYGMTSVKWLRSITVVDRPFEGYQQASAYHYRTDDAGVGEPVSRMLPRALMIPPGIPDFMSRTRFVTPSVQKIEGRAWSGHGEVTRVEFSHDGGVTWTDAELDATYSAQAWRRWHCLWEASTPGEHQLCARATDSAGNVQPLDQNWNLEGVENNAVQRVNVVVGEAGTMQPPADAEP